MVKATSKHKLPFRRRREAKTNYLRRIALLKSRKPRLVVRKQNRGLVVQIITFGYEGDRTIVTITNKHLRKMGWPAKRNAPTAYLMGLLAAKEAKAKGINEVVLDIGLHSPTKNSIVFAALKGAIDGGLSSKLGMELDEDRIKGVHIANYARRLKEEDKSLYSKHFSTYIKQKVDPEKLPDLFEKVKASIIGG